MDGIARAPRSMSRTRLSTPTLPCAWQIHASSIQAEDGCVVEIGIKAGERLVLSEGSVSIEYRVPSLAVECRAWDRESLRALDSDIAKRFGGGLKPNRFLDAAGMRCLSLAPWRRLVIAEAQTALP